MKVNSNTWLVAAGAGASLLAGFVLPPDAFLALVALVVLLASCAVGVMVQMGAPFLGLAVLVATAVAFPVEFRGPAGVLMGSSFPLAAMLCSVWLLRLVLFRRTDLTSSRPVVAALAFVGITLLSFAMGQFPWFPTPGAPLPAQIAELGLFALSVLLFLAAGDQLTSQSHLKWLTWLLVGTGAVACVLQMVPGLLPIARITSRPGSVGSLFWTWLTAVAFSQALLNRHLSVTARLGMLVVTGLVLVHGLVQVRSWASGWIPPITAMGVILLFRVPRLSIGLGLVGLPAALFVVNYLSSALLEEEAYSLMTRREAWVALWQVIERNPLLGTGMANYYYFTENLPILGWYVRFISHNNYQDLLVQTGFLGLLGFLWFAFEVFWLGLRLHRQLPAGFAKAYVVGAIGGLAGSLVAGMLGDWIIPFYYNAGILGFRSSLLFWVFLGGLLTLQRTVAAPVEAVAPAYQPWPLTARSHSVRAYS